MIGFVGCVLLRTAGDLFTAGTSLAPTWHDCMIAGQNASELFLICGMSAVGLSVAFNQMWRIGSRRSRRAFSSRCWSVRAACR